MPTTTIPADRLCRCANCGHEDDSDEVSLYDVSSLNDRLDPGSTVPAGECSACGCLTYLVAPRQDQALAEMLREAAAALESLDDACRNDQEHRDLIARLRAEAADRHGPARAEPADHDAGDNSGCDCECEHNCTCYPTRQ